jgi:hypothetical protein
VIEDEPAAFGTEESQNQVMTLPEVISEQSEGMLIDREHTFVQSVDVVESDFAFCRLRTIVNHHDLHEVRKI